MYFDSRGAERDGTVIIKCRLGKRYSSLKGFFRLADPLHIRTGETINFRDQDSSSPVGPVILYLSPVPVTVLGSPPNSRTHGTHYTTDDRWIT